MCRFCKICKKICRFNLLLNKVWAKYCQTLCRFAKCSQENACETIASKTIFARHFADLHNRPPQLPQSIQKEAKMENRLFTIASLFSTDHHFIIAFYTIVCAVVTVAVAKLATRKMSVIPNFLQNLHEAAISGMLYMAKDVIGEEKARKYFPLAGTIGFYVFYCNIIGMIPGFEAPTSAWDFTLVLALIVFFYYHFEGIRTQGVIHYFAHFMGPVKWLAPLMFPIEIISHLSRIISLSFRLFGNIKGDDMFLLVMLMLVPYLVPVVPFAILLFMAVLQAFVFMILTYVYLAGAVVVDEGHA